MILIFSEKEYEQGTDQVMNWLSYHKGNYLKITLDDLLVSKSEWFFDIDHHDILYKGISLREQVNVIWYRRLFRNNILERNLNRVADHHMSQLQQEIKRENLHLFNFLFSVLETKKWLPNSTHISLNKLQVLHTAKHCGLNIPQSRVLNSRKDVLQFFREMDGQLITKPIGDTSYYRKNREQLFLAFTTVLHMAMIEGYPEYFFPSLFQEKLNSVIELRIFYLDGELMTQAAMTSGGVSDKVDIKQRRQEQHIQYMVYRLPKLVEEKICRMMKELSLNIGSIDMIVTADDAYYFLEVNPGGQFFFESTNCNFQIENKIAQWLISNDISYESSLI